MLAAASVGVSACGGDGATNDTVVAIPTTTVPIAPQSILEFLASDPRFSTLAELVGIAGLSSTFSGTGSYTVFAPTNDAFTAFGDVELSRLKANQPALKRFLLSHVIEGELVYSDILEGTIDSLSTSELAFTLDGGARVNDVMIEESDYRLTNGMVHPVDAVLANG